jgi:hypothetical protein
VLDDVLDINNGDRVNAGERFVTQRAGVHRRTG